MNRLASFENTEAARTGNLLVRYRRLRYEAEVGRYPRIADIESDAHPL